MVHGAGRGLGSERDEVRGVLGVEIAVPDDARMEVLALRPRGWAREV
jgi:hypothetical protein